MVPYFMLQPLVNSTNKLIENIFLFFNNKANIPFNPTTTSSKVSYTTMLSNFPTTSFSINAYSLFTMNNTGSQLNNILSNYTGDLSACLANCSNQGICILNSLQQYICECSQYKTGKSCQSDTRPCSSNPCLNNGLCIDTNNQTLSFQCICPSLFYGIYCENKMDLCLNSSICFNNQGYCKMNGSQPVCKCIMGYSGVNCEIISSSLAVRKIIINVSAIIAFVVIAFFIFTILVFDYTKYFLMMKPIKKKQEIKKFQYHFKKVQSESE
jgi:hypothetical protein